VELYVHSPNMSSCHGTYLSTGTALPLPHLVRVFNSAHSTGRRNLTTDKMENDYE
jgi:hypothetical protein